MQQRLFLQVVIDQRNDTSKLRQTQPDGNKLRSILHQQSHFVAMLKAVLVENVCDTIFEVVDLQTKSSFKYCCVIMV